MRAARGEHEQRPRLVPATAERAGIEAALDAARHLAVKIQADGESAAETEAIIHEWRLASDPDRA